MIFGVNETIDISDDHSFPWNLFFFKQKVSFSRLLLFSSLHAQSHPRVDERRSHLGLPLIPGTFFLFTARARGVVSRFVRWCDGQWLGKLYFHWRSFQSRGTNRNESIRRHRLRSKWSRTDRIQLNQDEDQGGWRRIRGELIEKSNKVDKSIGRNVDSSRFKYDSSGEREELWPDFSFL